MDLREIIWSKDVADHCERINYQLNDYELVDCILRNVDMTYLRRLDLLRGIADSTNDKKLKALINSYMDEISDIYMRVFQKSRGDKLYIDFPVLFDFAKSNNIKSVLKLFEPLEDLISPDYYGYVAGTSEIMRIPCKTYKEAVDMGIQLSKKYNITSGFAVEYPFYDDTHVKTSGTSIEDLQFHFHSDEMDKIYHNSNGSICMITSDWESEYLSEYICSKHIKLPHPFKIGDFVITDTGKFGMISFISSKFKKEICSDPSGSVFIDIMEIGAYREDDVHPSEIMYVENFEDVPPIMIANKQLEVGEISLTSYARYVEDFVIDFVKSNLSDLYDIEDMESLNEIIHHIRECGIQ